MAHMQGKKTITTVIRMTMKTYKKTLILDHLWHFPFQQNICPESVFRDFYQTWHIDHQR